MITTIPFYKGSFRVPLMSASTAGANTGTRGGGRSSRWRGRASRRGSWRCSGWSSSSGRSPRVLWLHPSSPSHRRSGTSRTSSHRLEQSTVSTQPVCAMQRTHRQRSAHPAGTIALSHIWHQAAAKPTQPRFVNSAHLEGKAATLFSFQH